MPLKVELIAQTIITPAAEEILPVQDGVDDADHLTELAGRDCYQSFDRPNPETRLNADYISKNIIGKQHFSVMEHASCTLRITGVSRSLTHELIRHRHFSYSQLSQRYVDVLEWDYVIPPTVREWEDDEEREVMLEALSSVWELALEAYGTIEDIIAAKRKRKVAREAARAPLPNMTETIIDVTGNHRAWREFLEKRNSEHADEEIQELAAACLNILSEVAPAAYSDMR